MAQYSLRTNGIDPYRELKHPEIKLLGRFRSDLRKVRHLEVQEGRISRCSDSQGGIWPVGLIYLTVWIVSLVIQALRAQTTVVKPYGGETSNR